VIRFLLFIPLFIISTIIAISIYLQPNDLKKCNGVIGLSSSCQKVDAIVAISGGDTNARTDNAIELYKAGWADKLVFSGAAEDKTGPSNAKAMQVRAENAGVASSNIYLDETSESTHQNAENTKSIFATENIKSVILVTSGYHQRRASLEFKKSNPDIAIMNSSVNTDQDWSSWWWTGPRGWTLAVTEVFKITLFYLGAM